MKINTVMHFTDEIGTVEISTFRKELILVVPPEYRTDLTTDEEGRSYIRVTQDVEEE